MIYHLLTGLIIISGPVYVNGQAFSIKDTDPSVIAFVQAFYSKVLSDNNVSLVYNLTMTGKEAGLLVYPILYDNFKEHYLRPGAIAQSIVDVFQMVETFTFPVYISVVGNAVGRYLARKQALHSSNAVRLGDDFAKYVKYSLTFSGYKRIVGFFKAIAKGIHILLNDLKITDLSGRPDLTQDFYDIYKDAESRFQY